MESFIETSSGAGIFPILRTTSEPLFFSSIISVMLPSNSSDETSAFIECPISSSVIRYSFEADGPLTISSSRYHVYKYVPLRPVLWKSTESLFPNSATPLILAVP